MEWGWWVVRGWDKGGIRGGGWDGEGRIRGGGGDKGRRGGDKGRGDNGGKRRV